MPGPGDPVNITGVDNTWTAIRVRATTGAVAVGPITVAGVRTSADPLDLLVMPSDCLPELPDTPIANPAATSWSGLTFSTGSESVRDAVRLTAAISGDLTGPIDCGTIYRLQVGGAIKAPVTAAGPNREGVGAIGVIVAQRVENDGSGTLGAIKASSGDIGFVQVGGASTPGAMEGPIDAPLGAINNLTVVGPISIVDPVGVRARDGIGVLHAFGFVNGQQVRYNIAANVTSNHGGGTGSIDGIVCANFSGEGNFGQLTGVFAPGPAFSLSGVLTGSLHVAGDLYAGLHVGDMATGSAIVVDGNAYADVFSFSNAESIHVSGEVLNGIPGSLLLIGACGRAQSVHLGRVTHVDTTGIFHSVRLVAAEFGSVVVDTDCAAYIGPSQLAICSSAAGQYSPIESLSVGGTLAGVARLDPLGDLLVAGGCGITDETAGDGPPGMYLLRLPEARTVKFGQTLGGAGYIVAVDQVGGFGGQCILNAASQAGTSDFEGAVAIGVGTPPATLLHPRPHYANLAADLGGGAVGLVPFALHEADCDPPADATQASRTFLNSEFCHIPYARNLCEGSDPGEIYSDASIYLQFYGPILAESESERPYEIGIEVNGQPDYTTDYGMWTQYQVLPQLVGGAERRLRISGGEFTQLLAGHYYVRPKRSGSARLLCAGLLPGAAATPVADFTYEFWLAKDCNTNGVDDDEEQTGFCCLNVCDPDYNQDGNADQDDVAYLTNVVAGGYNSTGRDPDFDGDGNPNQDDVQALVNTIGGGGCP